MLDGQPSSSASATNPPADRPPVLPAATLERLRDDLIKPALQRRDDGLYLGARNIYTDPELFELELSHLFEGGWVFAAHESQMPNPHDFMTMTIGRQSVLLLRDGEGGVRGFFNVCMHRGARLCREKVGNRKVHMCRFHGWCYDQHGALVNVTAEKEGAYPSGFKRDALGLVPLPRVKAYRGFIFVSLSDEVESLPEYLGDASRFIDLMVDHSPSGEMEVIPGETAYTYSGNWKLSTENGLDGYHVQTLHANYVMTAQRRAEAQAGDTTKSLDLSNWGAGESGVFGFANGHGALFGPYPNFRDRPSFAHYDRFRERYGDEQADWMVKKLRNLFLMPNLLLGDQMSTQIRMARPIAVDLTEVVTWCIAPKGEDPAARERRIRQFEDFFNASGMATPDDLSEFRNCQLGFGAAKVPWSDLSRGRTRWVEGANDCARRIGISPLWSSSQAADESIYVSIIGQWMQRMSRAVEAELARAAA